MDITKALKRHKQVGECAGGGHRLQSTKRKRPAIGEQRQEEAERETTRGMGGEKRRTVQI